jgi:serine/threonine protein kinase
VGGKSSDVLANEGGHGYSTDPPKGPGRGSAPVGRGDATPGRLTVDENVLLPEGSHGGPEVRPAPITDLASLDAVREVGVSRFGVVRQLRRPTVAGDEFFAAKCYHVGPNRDRRQFESLMRPFLELSHPHVMPIAGLIPPIRDAGPVILSPYQEGGSLEAILDLVRQNDPPAFWTDAGKAFLIAGLLSGVIYLHSRGVVHGDLKPNDIMVDSTGSIRICDFMTGKLEDAKFTLASQVGSPSYSAPEVSGGGDSPERTMKADVFSIGLILYEIVSGQRVFPSTLSPGMIWRRAQDPKPGARPVIPRSVHDVLKSCIQRCWVPDPARRPKLVDVWKQLREVRFGFPDAPLDLIHLSTSI